MNPSNPSLRVLAGSLLLSLSGTLHGSIQFYVSTDAGGAFNAPSGGGATGPAAWTGNGMVQPNFNSSTNSGTPVLVSGLSAGTLSNLSMDVHGTSFDYTFTLIGDGNGAPSADLIGTFASDVQADDWRGMALSNMMNVAGLSVKTTFAEPIAPRLAGAGNNVPWGIGMRRHSGSATSYDVTSATYSGLTTITGIPGAGVTPMAGVHYNSGLTGVAGSPALINVNDSMLGDPAGPFGSVVNADTTLMTGITATSQWIGLHGIDFDGLTGGDGPVDNSSGGNGILDNDTERVYLNMVELGVAESSGNAFPNNTRFQFTIDGFQYDDTLPIAIEANSMEIPEPGRATLLVLAGSLIGLRRRR